MEMLFETERLIVRKLKAEDAKQLYENHMDEEVRKWFPNECYADLEEARDAIRFYADCVDHGKLPFVLGVELKGTGELIGFDSCCYTNNDIGRREVRINLGYFFHREWRRR